MQQNERTFLDKSGVEYTVHGKRLVKCTNTGIQCYRVSRGTRLIDEDAFEDCDKLQQVTLPDTVVGIGDWAFCRCKALEEMVIPASVTTIGSRAFSNCKSLKNIRLIGKVKKLGDYAFLSCEALESIVVPRSTMLDYQAILPKCYWPLLKEGFR